MQNNLWKGIAIVGIWGACLASIAITGRTNGEFLLAVWGTYIVANSKL